jgi:hypothetical protein
MITATRKRHSYRRLRAQGVSTRLLTDLELDEDEDENLRRRARNDLLRFHLGLTKTTN